MKSFLTLTALLLLAAGVGACDPVLEPTHDSLCCPLPDTTRFYAKVDTVVVCIQSWDGTSGRGADTTFRFDTTWLPKVQVWMDSVEYKEWIGRGWFK